MARKEMKAQKSHNPFERFLRHLRVRYNPKDLTLTVQFPKQVGDDETQSDSREVTEEPELVQETVPIVTESTSQSNPGQGQGQGQILIGKDLEDPDIGPPILSEHAKTATPKTEDKKLLNPQEAEDMDSEIEDIDLEAELASMRKESQPVRVQITMKAYIKMALHSLKYANPTVPRTKWVEVIGLLTGHIKHKDTPLACMVVQDAFPIGHGTDVNVQIQDPQSHVKVYQAKQKDEIILGWYHSHPSYGAFMSQTDYQTQLRYQKLSPGSTVTQPFALVIDPTRISNSSYGFKVFRLTNQYRNWDEPKYEILNLPLENVPEMMETLLPLTEGKAMFLEYE